jgi:hypothetical protein
VPNWPAPPDVNASSTRMVGVLKAEVCVVSARENSTRNSLNNFLP